MKKIKDDDEIVRVAYDFVNVGIKRWKLGDLENAKESYEQAIKLLRTASLWVVDYSDVVEGLGDINRALGLYEVAISCYTDAWGSDHLKIGHVYYEDLKDYKKASDLYKEILFLSVNSYSSKAAFNLAKMAWNGEGQQKSHIYALMWMQVGFLMDPKSDEFINAISQLKTEMSPNDIQEALILFDDYIKNRNANMEERKRNDPWANVRM